MRCYEPLIGAIVASLRLPCGCERADVAQEARLGLLQRDPRLAARARTVPRLRRPLRPQPGAQGIRRRRRAQAPVPLPRPLAGRPRAARRKRR